MKKLMLMSGNCRLGIAGKETKMIDSFGKNLRVGDLVALSTFDEDNPYIYKYFSSIQFVCDNEFEDNGLDKKKFVMGVASEHKEYEDGDGETIVHQNHKKWRIERVKSYKDLVNGEEWGAVRAMFSD